MSQCHSNKGIADSTAGRAEVIAAIGRLADEVAHLALHFKINVAIVAADKAERAADALRAVAKRMTETVEPQSILEAEPGDEVKTHDTQLSCIAEAAMAVTPLQPDGIVETRQSEMGVETALYAARSDLAKVDVASGEPTHASCHVKNAIATRVLELQDRLGGFIWP